MVELIIKHGSLGAVYVQSICSVSLLSCGPQSLVQCSTLPGAMVTQGVPFDVPSFVSKPPVSFTRNGIQDLFFHSGIVYIGHHTMMCA